MKAEGGETGLTMSKTAIKKRIERAIKRFAQAASNKAFALVPQSMTSGKLYEAHVLSLVIEQLVVTERYRVVLVNTNFITLKSAPGPINRSYPYFRLEKNGRSCAEIWTDVEFLSLSHAQLAPSSLTRGAYHELDILVVDHSASGRPRHDQIWLGVECKNTGYSKSLLKEILGIRRELSLLQSPQSTRFNSWPRSTVPASPSSCLLVYATDSSVQNYSEPGDFFGIDFFHETL